MRMRILLLAGDGIGPEVVSEAVRVLRAVEKRFRCKFDFCEGVIGCQGIKQSGEPLPTATLSLMRGVDAILFGSVGGVEGDIDGVRPEDGLLKLRKETGLFANIRPVKPYAAVLGASPIKEEYAKDADFVIVRELLGGLYFGKPKKRMDSSRGQRAVDTLAYTEKQIERLLKVGFDLAQTRRKKLHSVDKRNVLETSRLWHDIANEMNEEYPDVKLEHMLVDNAAVQILTNPKQFDVIVTENTFGDILSDEASVVAGSLGMLPSASLSGSVNARRSSRGSRRPSLYEPIHGAAPTLAGHNVANPIATILSAAMMLRISFKMETAAQAIEEAIASVLDDGYRTKDIALTRGASVVTTSQMGSLIAERLAA